MYKKAINLLPGYALAHANLGFMYLLQGNLEKALEHRKWRWKTEDRKNKLNHLELPEWDGKASKVKSASSGRTRPMMLFLVTRFEYLKSWVFLTIRKTY